MTATVAEKDDDKLLPQRKRQFGKKKRKKTKSNDSWLQKLTNKLILYSDVDTQYTDTTGSRSDDSIPSVISTSSRKQRKTKYAFQDAEEHKSNLSSSELTALERQDTYCSSAITMYDFDEKSYGTWRGIQHDLALKKEEKSSTEPDNSNSETLLFAMIERQLPYGMNEEEFENTKRLEGWVTFQSNVFQEQGLGLAIYKTSRRQ